MVFIRCFSGQHWWLKLICLLKYRASSTLVSSSPGPFLMLYTEKYFSVCNIETLGIGLG